MFLNWKKDNLPPVRGTFEFLSWLQVAAIKAAAKKQAEKIWINNMNHN